MQLLREYGVRKGAAFVLFCGRRSYRALVSLWPVKCAEADALCAAVCSDGCRYALISDDPVHRDVVRLRKDCFNLKRCEGDADRQWAFLESSQGPIEIATAIAQPVTGAIKA